MQFFETETQLGLLKPLFNSQTSSRYFVHTLPPLDNSYLSLVSIWTFFAFRCSFWFFVPTKSHNEQCDAQMETSTKNQNEQQKAITSNKRHLPVLVFEIELILSQKQERATKSSKRQRTANGNTHQKPKRATKSNKEHFSFPFSFIRTSSGPEFPMVPLIIREIFIFTVCRNCFP